jgi:Fe-S-cluster containining protein
VTACASLLCDACAQPGRCCTGFELGGGLFGAGETALEMLVRMATTVTAMTPEGYAIAVRTNPTPPDHDHVMIGLPFMPFYRRADGRWRLWCPVLGRDGRCTDYENRPALCRSFEAGSESLCVMHHPSPTELETRMSEPPTFQQRVDAWIEACFGAESGADRVERNHRFLEEALELAQANGCTRHEAHQLVDYVFSRPTGEANQEAGGVMVTLSALCSAAGIDLATAAKTELARVWSKIDTIRAKQAAKPKHSPLPE